MEVIKAATAWQTNADLIVDLNRLGYLKDEDFLLDPTFGMGVWWRKWEPDTEKGGCLVMSDLKWGGADFRHLPFEDGTFDCVAFDPPYVAMQRKLKETDISIIGSRFGLDYKRTPQDVLDLIIEGMSESTRVLKPKGRLLVKCMDYHQCSRYHPNVYYVMRHGLECLGLKVLDRMEHLSEPRTQPWETQRTARRNHSTLLVFKKTGAGPSTSSPSGLL